MTDYSISKVIAAVDGSFSSKKAAEYAIEFAKKYHSKLIFLSILHIPSSFGLATPQMIKDLKKDEAKELDDFLEPLKAIAVQHGIDTESKVMPSAFSVEAAIVNFAEEQKADLIVISTTGKSGIKKLLIGSVASKVLTYATCPVMVIK